ncbi:hypothetical protein LLG10_04355 [bacterium]|nr:hypothetical protein [bacterium]
MKKINIELIFIALLFIGLGLYKNWNTQLLQASNLYLLAVVLLSSLAAVYLRRLSQLFWCYKWGDINLTLKGNKNHYPTEWIDWIGLIVFVFFQFGWGKPLLSDKTVKNPDRKKRIILLVTGLLVNLIVVFLILMLIPYTESFSLTLAAFLKLFAQVNLHYFLISLIPFPPFDLGYLWQSLWSNKSKPQTVEIVGLTLVFILIFVNIFPQILQIVSNKLLYLILA